MLLVPLLLLLFQVFESQPKQSAAEAGSLASVAALRSGGRQLLQLLHTCVSTCICKVSHNDKTFAQGSDKSVFESEPQQSKAEAQFLEERAVWATSAPAG